MKTISKIFIVLLIFSWMLGIKEAQAATRLQLRAINGTEVMPNAKQSADAINRDVASSVATYSTPAQMLVVAGSGTQENSTSVAEPGAAHYTHYGSWISNPLTAQTVSGTVTIALVMAEGNALANANPRVKIYKWLANDTFGSDLLALTTSATETIAAYPSAPATFFSAQAITSTDFALGDKIVIEIETYDNNTKTTAYLHGIRFDGADTGGYGGYVEFSANITFQETTTLGDGTDPGPSTVAPGSTSNYLDQFTFVTSSSTDSVTALTVTTVNTTAVASVAIWNEAMTQQYFGTVSSPAGDAWNFSSGTAIPVTTSSASFRVIFTATSHAALAEGTYGVTGYVSSFTSGNAQASSDSAGTTITVDNTPPSNATWGTITPGNTQIVLNWTNPGADFYRVMILRKIGSVVGDAPTEGTEYVQGNEIGTSIVRYVGNLQTFTDTGLTNGTNYYYKIFAYDSSINYAAGVGTGPHTPILTLSISVSPVTWGVGIVDVNTVQVSTSGNKIGVTNNGNVAETFTLQIFNQDDRGEWTASSLKGGKGNNIYVLSGIFCATTDSPTDTSFNGTDSEDVITTTLQIATDTKFAYSATNGVGVPVSETRSLWLRLDMPTTVSGTFPYDLHTITVRIGCQ